MKIVAHTIVRNEENWIWYSLMSVINHIGEIIIWDTGSTDRTVGVIRSIKNQKIKFRTIGITENESDLSKARNQMLEETNADWLMILDGDEIWLENSIQTAVNFINTQGQLYDSIIVPTLNCVGDVFHTTSPGAGRYSIAGKTGHYNLRFINLKNVPGLHVSNPSGQLQSYFDSDGIKIQNRNPQKIAFIDIPYLHMTHLTRSLHDKNVFWRSPKFKYDLGDSLSDGFEYPKCFYQTRPRIVPSPWSRRSLFFILNAAWQTPLKLAKRRIFK